MASALGDADVEYISLDLIIQILLWLPVSSLLRLKSVCKCWHSLIQSPDFVYQHHLLTSSKQESPHRFISLSWQPCDFIQHPVSLVSVNNSSKQVSYEPLDFPTIEGPHQYNPVLLVASCNGIICLKQDYRVCLWNPATKQSTILPSLPVLPLWCTIGFGFDVKTNDYKVLCIDNKANPTAHLYSLTSDSWTSIAAPVSSRVHFRWQLKTPYKNRLYCCWIDNLSGGSERILSFDFSDEAFGTILLPEDRSIRDPFGLFILRDNIACCNRVDVGVCFEMWMLNDYNVKESWTKLYSISSSSLPMVCHWVMGFSRNGDFLLLPMHDSGFIDIVTQELIDHPVHASNDFQFTPYEESLVSVKRGNHATNIFDSELQDRGGMMLINQPVIGSNSWADTDIPGVELFHILLLPPVVSVGISAVYAMINDHTRIPVQILRRSRSRTVELQNSTLTKPLLTSASCFRVI